ncbi:MAG: endolytic transglycosylase MltG [Cyclobacteriaceae bacterium]|nr:endolytic transglycosylase MltG [Cyclobacteriaceae bacterium]
MIRKYLSTIVLLLFGILISSFSFYGYQVVKAPNILVDMPDREIIIPTNATFHDIQNQFIKEEVVNNIVAFSFLAKIMNYDKKVVPGRYLLKKNMNNIDAIRLLRSGNQIPVNITFNNIRLKEDIGEKITSKTGVTVEDFNVALDEFVSENEAGFTDQNVIAMFIPNTYQVYYTISAKALVNRMHQEYNAFWNNERLAKAEALGMTPMEVSILASIVQAESIKSEESPIIAGLYINRLKRGIALSADPTLVFASGDFTLKRVLNIHKEIDSPYNTYKYRGLPPGPINMPFISSIDAVLNYNKHNYLYMCAKEDFSGYHNFASTLKVHNINASKYQRALSIEMRKARQNGN